MTVKLYSVTKEFKFEDDIRSIKRSVKKGSIWKLLGADKYENDNAMIFIEYVSSEDTLLIGLQIGIPAIYFKRYFTDLRA